MPAVNGRAPEVCRVGKMLVRGLTADSGVSAARRKGSGPVPSSEFPKRMHEPRPCLIDEVYGSASCSNRSARVRPAVMMLWRYLDTSTRRLAKRAAETALSIASWASRKCGTSSGCEVTSGAAVTSVLIALSSSAPSTSWLRCANQYNSYRPFVQRLPSYRVSNGICRRVLRSNGPGPFRIFVLPQSDPARVASLSR